MILCIGACGVKKEVDSISVGKVISTEICEFKIEDVNITKNILPRNAGDFSGYVKGSEYMVYVDLCVEYSNLSTDDIKLNEALTCQMTYENDKKIIGKKIIENESRSSFPIIMRNDEVIEPQTTRYIHCYFEVPERIATSDNKITMFLNISKNTYEFIARDENGIMAEGSTIRSAELNKIELGETIIGENIEVSIDDIEFTKRTKGRMFYKEPLGNNVFLDVCLIYKNADNEEAEENIYAKLKCSELYEYTGFSETESYYAENDDKEKIMHYYFNVPETMEFDDEPIEVILSIDGDTYSYNFR